MVKPKPRVFVEEISHLLVICTPVSVLLIGVSSISVPTPNNRTHKDIKLYATDMSIATDNIEMSNVIGTAEGRIMMSGNQDGNLYELHYQETESWFGKKVKLINHSVGGVQSFLPKFSAPKSDGECLNLISLSETRTLVRADHVAGLRPVSQYLLHPVQQQYYLCLLPNSRHTVNAASTNAFKFIQVRLRKGSWIPLSHTSKLPHYLTPCHRPE